MAIFMYVKEIAGDAKDMGWRSIKGSAAKQDESLWYIRLDSFTLSGSNEQSDDTEATPAPNTSDRQITGGAPAVPAAAPGTKKKKKKDGTSIELTKKLDYASASFSKMALNKQGETNSKLEAYKEILIYVTSSQRELILQVTLSHVIATSYSLQISSNDDGMETAETVNLQYQKIEWEYNETDTQGKIIYADRMKWPINAPAS
jgi:type VI protein secretion system component Hcp